MIRCNSCAKQQEVIHYTGPVLFVEGSAAIDSNGTVSSLGPAKAIITIEVGKELSSPDIVLVCPSCGARGDKSQFTIVRPCIISGTEGDVEFHTPFGVSVWVHHDFVTQAEVIFSAERADWQVSAAAVEALLHV